VPEEPKPEEPKPEEVAPAPAPVVPEGPERPPEPTIGNGKYKAKGTGLMIAGGTLFGVGLAGVLTTYFLTRCDEIEDNVRLQEQAEQHLRRARDRLARAARRRPAVRRRRLPRPLQALGAVDPRVRRQEEDRPDAHLAAWRRGLSYTVKF
jgi:hypothetical protein